MRVLFALVVLAALLAGCGQAPRGAGTEPRPTPTIAPFFRGDDQALPTFEFPTPIARATTAAGDRSGPSAGDNDPGEDDRYDEVVIYDDRLAPGWNLTSSWDQRINPESRAFAGSGLVSLEAVPLADFGGVTFASAGQNVAIYPRDEMVGVRLLVSGGVRHLTPFSLIVKVLGSNRYPYFVQGDDSVRFPDGVVTDKPVFDEVGLDALGMRRDLEPGEWAEVELRLDGYDQVDYAYVTGLVVMNDSSYDHPFYIDRVTLLFRRP